MIVGPLDVGIWMKADGRERVAPRAWLLGPENKANSIGSAKFSTGFLDWPVYAIVAWRADI